MTETEVELAFLKYFIVSGILKGILFGALAIGLGLASKFGVTATLFLTVGLALLTDFLMFFLPCMRWHSKHLVDGGLEYQQVFDLAFNELGRHKMCQSGWFFRDTETILLEG